ncbi:hypothetical protein [Marinomonas shanghaiensis]|uniref:hypothetical protein n=1 Tax=Marinomonas shanghaiensis TaxID=2202418 RepID=UPI003A8E1536
MILCVHFSSSNVILSLIAAGLSSQAVGILANIGFLPQLGSQVWDSSFLLSSNGWGGVLAHSVSYTATLWGCKYYLVCRFVRYFSNHSTT